MGKKSEKTVRKNKRETFRRIITAMSFDRLGLALAFLLLSGGTLLGILAPIVIKQLTDSLAADITSGAGVDFILIGRLLLLLAALYVVSNAFLYLANVRIVRISQTVLCNLRNQISRKLNVMLMSHLDATPRGSVLSCATNDVLALGTALETNFAKMISQITSLVGIMLMALFVNPKLSTVFFVFVPLSLFLIKLITAVTQKLFRRQQAALSELNSLIEEMTAGHDVMKAFHYEVRAAERFEVINKRFFDTYFYSRSVSGLTGPVIKVLNSLLFLVLCFWGAFEVMNGDLTIGGLQAFLIYAVNISSPIRQFSNDLNMFQAGIASADRIFDLLDSGEETPDNVLHNLPADRVQGRVTFEHVRFGYLPGKTLMHDVSFSTEPGQVFAIVGPSGAGKTTLVNLLMRFYEIDGGRIRLDGIDISELSRKNLRESLGMVLQDTWIFDGTVAENIAYGKQGATGDEIISAARRTQCDSFIRLLPDGYDTHISDALSTLSSGEKQLLSIARTVIAEPKILILDEATSSIDTRTELLITKAMRELMKGRTTFIIAHRLFTIKKADAIIFMKDGDILEVGTHEQLLARAGEYAAMYRAASD